MSENTSTTTTATKTPLTVASVLSGKWFVAPAMDDTVATNGHVCGKVIAVAPGHIVVRLKSWKRHQSLHLRTIPLDDTVAFRFARTEDGARKLQNAVAPSTARTPKASAPRASQR